MQIYIFQVIVIVVFFIYDCWILYTVFPTQTYKQIYSMYSSKTLVFPNQGLNLCP